MKKVLLERQESFIGAQLLIMILSLLQKITKRLLMLIDLEPQNSSIEQLLDDLRTHVER